MQIYAPLGSLNIRKRGAKVFRKHTLVFVAHTCSTFPSTSSYNCKYFLNEGRRLYRTWIKYNWCCFRKYKFQFTGAACRSAADLWSISCTSKFLDESLKVFATASHVRFCWCEATVTSVGSSRAPEIQSSLTSSSSTTRLIDILQNIRNT